jgi:hypothetical protein
MSNEQNHIQFIGKHKENHPLDDIQFPIDSRHRRYFLNWTSDELRMAEHRYLRNLETDFQKIPLHVRLQFLQLDKHSSDLDVHVLAHRFFVDAMTVDFNSVISFLMTEKGLYDFLTKKFPGQQDHWDTYVTDMVGLGPLGLYLQFRKEVSRLFYGKNPDEFMPIFNSMPAYLKLFWSQLSILRMVFPFLGTQL